MTTLSLLIIPKDILTIICTNIHPADLLILREVCGTIRDIIDKMQIHEEWRERCGDDDEYIEVMYSVGPHILQWKIIEFTNYNIDWIICNRRYTLIAEIQDFNVFKWGEYRYKTRYVFVKGIRMKHILHEDGPLHKNYNVISCDSYISVIKLFSSLRGYIISYDNDIMADNVPINNILWRCSERPPLLIDIVANLLD